MDQTDLIDNYTTSENKFFWVPHEIFSKTDILENKPSLNIYKKTEMNSYIL
jgi:hypothetical protein